MKKWNDFNSREKLAILFTLNKGKCSYCKKQVRIGQRVDKKGERATVDHKIPVVGGGSDSFDNLTLACHECNVKKFDQDTYTKRKKVYLTKRRTGKKGYQQQLFKEEQ